MQRAITDFGADISFARVLEKMREHYGIVVSASTVATITTRHAHAVTPADTMPTSRPTSRALTLIAEVDGSMIPLVDTGTVVGAGVDAATGANPGHSGRIDLRKTRQLSWKEAKLSLVKRSDEIAPVFAVTLADVTTAGSLLKQLAVATGLNGKSRVHALGDGAPWIAEQVERQFGAQGHYLVDFYHLCDYLAAASKVCDKEHPEAWMTLQKERMKTGQSSEVMAALRPFLEADELPSEASPVRQCYRYLAHRPGQFNYREALAENLPIGSGEVESAHRYVIQKRLKLPGAWWKKNNAQAMLNLRVLRANQQWENYWHKNAA